MTPICWLRSMSSINCFCSIFSLPTVCLMNTCWSRSSTFGLSSKSLIRHLWGEVGEEGKGRSRSAMHFLDLNSKHLVFALSVEIFIIRRGNHLQKAQSFHTHLQMKSLKLSDQSSGWWRVGGGFLFKRKEWEKINGEIRRDEIYTARARRTKGRGAERNIRVKLLFIKEMLRSRHDA